MEMRVVEQKRNGLVVVDTLYRNGKNDAQVRRIMNDKFEEVQSILLVNGDVIGRYVNRSQKALHNRVMRLLMKEDIPDNGGIRWIRE